MSGKRTMVAALVAFLVALAIAPVAALAEDTVEYDDLGRITYESVATGADQETITWNSYVGEDTEPYERTVSVFQDSGKGYSYEISTANYREGILLRKVFYNIGNTTREYYKDGKLAVTCLDEGTETAGKETYTLPDGSVYMKRTYDIVDGDWENERIETYSNGSLAATATVANGEDGHFISSIVKSGSTISADIPGMMAIDSNVTITQTFSNGTVIEARFDREAETLTVTSTPKGGETTTYTGACEGFKTSGITDWGTVIDTYTAEIDDVVVTYVCCGTEVADASITLPTTPRMIVTTPVYDGTKSVEFHSSDTLANFTALYIDDALVDAANYDLSEGSIAVVLHDDYLKKLGAGTHSIRIDSANGSATSSFTLPENVDELVDAAIAQKAVDKVDKNTGDETPTPAVDKNAASETPTATSDSAAKNDSKDDAKADSKDDTAIVKPVDKKAVPATFDASFAPEAVATLAAAGGALVLLGLRKKR